MGIICKIIGHKEHKVNTNNMTAICKRCNKKLEVSYDMLYGETIIVKAIDDK